MDYEVSKNDLRSTALIYVLLDPERWVIRYVGKTTTARLRQRYNEHCQRTSGRLYVGRWIAKLARNGLRPVLRVLQRIPEESTQTWQDAERWWIEVLQLAGCPLTNTARGGLGGGFRHTDETKKKLSLAHRGKVLSEEHRKKISAAHKGKTRSPEHRAAIGKAHKGNQHRKGCRLSEEHKKRISEGNKGFNQYTRGHKMTEATKEKIRAGNKGKHHGNQYTRGYRKGA